MENIEQEIFTKIVDFKAMAASFSQLLEEENAALQKFDVEAVTKLYDRKAKIVEMYRAMVAYFIKNQETLAQLEKSEKENLKDISIKLEQLLHDNDTLLKTRMETSKNVMSTIVHIAKMTNNTNATSYGARGCYNPQDNNHNALAINKTL